MKENKTNFFESVAHHNLERFHSETIAWIFNTFPDAAKAFIIKINAHHKINNDEIQNIKCEAEIRQIDIKLEYTIAGVPHFIIIENKLKTTEHKIPYKVWVKELSEIVSRDFLRRHIESEMEISQTEYYYLREMNKFPDNKSQFIYLMPNIVNPNNVEISKIKSEMKGLYDFEKLNFWTFSIANPWITINYKDFVDSIGNNNFFESNNNQNKIIAIGYLNYIKSDAFSKYIDIENFNNNVFGRFEYFKLLFAIVKSKFQDKSILNTISNDNEEYSIYEYIQAGSSNGGLPLFAFYKRVFIGNKLPFFKEFNNYINIGIQVQGNNLKYYISADNSEYNTVTVVDQPSYKLFVERILLSFDDNLNLKFHTNKSKSFFSRSYKIDGFVDDKNPRDIFSIAKEISIKVNLFIKNDTSKLVQTVTQELFSKI